jgi:hypothetical protein
MGIFAATQLYNRYTISTIYETKTLTERIIGYMRIVPIGYFFPHKGSKSYTISALVFLFSVCQTVQVQFQVQR